MWLLRINVAPQRITLKIAWETVRNPVRLQGRKRATDEANRTSEPIVQWAELIDKKKGWIVGWKSTRKWFFFEENWVLGVGDETSQPKKSKKSKSQHAGKPQGSRQ